MNIRKFVVITIAIAMAAVATAAEAAWPNGSASELATYMTLQRFRIYSEHCASRLPQLKPQFERLVEGLRDQVERISQTLLASEVFKGMKDAPVPAVIVDAFRDSFSDMEHNFERGDPASICPMTLKKLGELNEASLTADLSQSLRGVQNMIRNLERHAP